MNKYAIIYYFTLLEFILLNILDSLDIINYL